MSVGRRRSFAALAATEVARVLRARVLITFPVAATLGWVELGMVPARRVDGNRTGKED